MLTVDEVARLTVRSPELLRRWVRTGELPAQRAGTRILLSPDCIPLIEARPRANHRRPSLA